MNQLEWHGLLVGAQKGSRRLDLDLSLYATATGGDALWAERQPVVPVGPRGQVHLVVGSTRPLPDGAFDRAPRWLEIAHDGAPLGPRIPLLGHAIRLHQRLAALEAGRPGGALSLRVDQLERRVARVESLLRRLRDGHDHLHDRLHQVELDPARDRLQQDVLAVEERLGGPLERRLRRVEDELLDLVGADGEVVDLARRLEAVEAAPSTRNKPQPAAISDATTPPADPTADPPASAD